MHFRAAVWPFVGRFRTLRSIAIGNTTQLESLDESPVDNTQVAYEQVRAAILTGALAPGTVISQVRLAAELNTSRTPLREALRLLQTEGLVQSDFNRRVRVAPLSVEDLEALYAMRIALESLAVRLTVSQLGADDLAELRTDLEEVHGQERALPQDIAGAHRRFHCRLFSRVGARFRREVEAMWDQGERYRIVYQEYDTHRASLVALAMREHELILEAAQAGDGALCGRRVAEHLARNALTIIAKVDGSHDAHVIREALRHIRDASPDPAGT
jgi:DNA-binding GntR family transcriptional regulator